MQRITDPSHMIIYLETTLIPDLNDSDMPATARDFEDCVAIIKDLQSRLCQCPDPRDLP